LCQEPNICPIIFFVTGILPLCIVRRQIQKHRKKDPRSIKMRATAPCVLYLRVTKDYFVKWKRAKATQLDKLAIWRTKSCDGAAWNWVLHAVFLKRLVLLHACRKMFNCRKISQFHAFWLQNEKKGWKGLDSRKENLLPDQYKLQLQNTWKN
jgi:hypothetical protein